MTSLKIDDNLYQYTTPRQRQILEAIDRLGSAKAASLELGLNKGAASETYIEVKRKAAKMGYSPEHDFTRPVPDGYTAKGVSTYYNKEGKPTAQWVKASVDNERQKQIIEAAVAAMCEDIKPVAPVGSPTSSLDQLLTQYTFTDFHLGALCWHREGGADWDVQIAYETGIGVMKMLVEGAPQSRSAVVNIQGDFLHADGILPVTPSHGHILDADSRFGKVVDVAIKLIRHLVDMALQKHENVTLLICEGNHDISSSIWLRKMFVALYENEPRVSVNDSDLPYYVIEHGNTMLAYHHGHLKKNEGLPLLFAAQFAPLWGRTTKRYANCGHRHHAEEKEHSGMTVIQHPTLAARDAYAARGGWFAERAATAITFHKKFGRVGTNTATPEMLEDDG
jgi:hypothetical protein